MSSDTENKRPSKSLIESLTARNRELTQTIEQAEEPKIVTIPYERRQAEIELIRQAAQFQPELYSKIELLATKENLEDNIQAVVDSEEKHLKKVTAKLLEQCEESTAKMQKLIEQDGKNREKFTSECSSALRAEREKFREQMEDFQRRSRRLLIAVFLTAIALSALVSYLLYRVLA